MVGFSASVYQSFYEYRFSFSCTVLKLLRRVLLLVYFDFGFNSFRASGSASSKNILICIRLSRLWSNVIDEPWPIGGSAVFAIQILFPPISSVGHSSLRTWFMRFFNRFINNITWSLDIMNYIRLRWNINISTTFIRSIRNTILFKQRSGVGSQVP